jgi:hypothetical protein
VSAQDPAPSTIFSATEINVSAKSGPRKYTPAVARHWLLLIAGLLWSGVGITLCVVACFWLSHGDWPQSGLSAALGVGLGVCVYRMGFSTMARKNIRRISQQPEKVCFFAFQAWRSYLLIIIMTLLGVALRQSHLSRFILATIYLTIGTGLILSSTLYYDEFIQVEIL